ncbi:formimidoylglutamate deiminase [Nocardioides pacificus]
MSRERRPGSGGPLGAEVEAAYLLERGWVAGEMRDEVLVEIAGGRFSRVLPDAPPAAVEAVSSWPGVVRLPGVTVPGLANSHSHAFHRALRGRSEAGRGRSGHGSFWTWRARMYDVAHRLDPDTYFALARATYREMVASGITAVGEFHYLHHQPDGTPYDEPNAMGLALLAAAREAGLRIALLDTCYLAAGFGPRGHRPAEGVQVRFSDGHAGTWAQRVADLPDGEDHVVGAAIHSVRAVPRDQLATVVDAARHRPLHVHLSEQPAENAACLAAYGRTPTALLADAGVLGPHTTAVHATHLTEGDVHLLGDSATRICVCPTTERDLGDGIGPALRLHERGCALTLGSDSHAVIDLFEEMRALEMHERLATGARGHFCAEDLLPFAAARGHFGLGFSDAGRIEAGERADLVTVDTTSIRTAGTGDDEQTVVFAASAADVRHVVADGRVVFRAGDEEEIGRELAAAVGQVWA